MPHTIWFGIIVSSDVFLYLFAAILFYFWKLNNKKLEKFILGLSAATLFVRPGGLALVVSRLIFLILNKFTLAKYFYFYFILAMLGFLYFLPYFLFTQTYIVEVHQTNLSITDKFLDFFEIFGFHTSRSSLSMAYFIRYFYGLIFLVGFVNIVLYPNKFKIPVLLTVASVFLFLYPTWRYILPVIPILYFNGTRTIHGTFVYFGRRKNYS